MKKNESPKKSNWSRRSFLRTFGVGVPLLSLVGEGADVHAEQEADSPQGGYDRDKFTPLDLSQYFNASPSARTRDVAGVQLDSPASPLFFSFLRLK